MNETTTSTDLSPLAEKALSLITEEWMVTPKNFKIHPGWPSAREELKDAGLIEELYGQIRLTQVNDEIEVDDPFEDPEVDWSVFEKSPVKAPESLPEPRTESDPIEVPEKAPEASQEVSEPVSSSPASEHEFRKAVFASDMPTARKLVALAFASYADPKTGENSHPKQATIAADTSLSDRYVRTNVKALEKDGWLVVTKRMPKGIHVYRLGIPDRNSSS